MKLSPKDLRDMNLFKYYRLTRRWVTKTYKLSSADFELLVYLDCKEFFKRQDFIDGAYTYTWDKNRWERLRREGWIDVFKERNRTSSKYAVYQMSRKAKSLITRVYRILLGEENLPQSSRSVFYKNKTYTDKTFNKAIDDMIKDKER
jgi:hypothetical protein